MRVGRLSRYRSRVFDIDELELESAAASLKLFNY